ncbi:MAG: hypothetical protein WCH65_02710 [bacterium]
MLDPNVQTNLISGFAFLLTAIFKELNVALALLNVAFLTATPSIYSVVESLSLNAAA